MIREIEKLSGRHVPIIRAMTAHSLKGDRDRCISAGMDDCVSKPICTSELFATIQKFTESKIPALREDRLKVSENR